MLCRNFKQGKECEDLKAKKRNLEIEVRNWESHIPRLKDKIRFEQLRLDNLRRQLERTGDTSFQHDIAAKEDEIANLERQVGVAEDNAQEWRDKLAEVIAQIGMNDCSGFGHA